jgi:hypothetical protein
MPCPVENVTTSEGCVVESSETTEQIAAYDRQGIARGDVLVQEFLAADDEEPVCQVCGKAMRWVAPGFSSRTGQPYSGFYGCEDWRDDDHRGRATAR